jgi:hypothetical protein
VVFLYLVCITVCVAHESLRRPVPELQDADIGTKALPDRQFAYLRDLMNGYAMIKVHHPSYPVPSYALERK